MKDEIKEIKINKENKSITFINNGIAFSQFGIADEILDLIIDLQDEYEKEHYLVDKLTRQLNDEYKNTEYQCKQKENIKKEIREKLLCYGETFDNKIHQQMQKELLEILDKHISKKSDNDF